MSPLSPHTPLKKNPPTTPPGGAVKTHPLLPLTLVLFAPANQEAPTVAALSLIEVQSIETVPLVLDTVAAVPALELMSLASLPLEAVVVKPVTVVVVEAGNVTPVVSPRLLRAIV